MELAGAVGKGAQQELTEHPGVSWEEGVRQRVAQLQTRHSWGRGGGRGEEESEGGRDTCVRVRCKNPEVVSTVHFSMSVDPSVLPLTAEWFSMSPPLSIFWRFRYSLSIYPSIYLSIYVSIYLFISLSLSLSPPPPPPHPLQRARSVLVPFLGDQHPHSTIFSLTTASVCW